VQRGHQNAVEGLEIQLSFALLGVLYSPMLVSIGNVAWMVGRVMYQQGYANGGPSGRMKGALVLHLGELLCLIAAVGFCWNHAF
jgi:glutathione S-transferase